MCNKCGKYGHRSSDLWGNENKNRGKTRFNGEGHNCGRKGHRSVDCWSKNIEKDDDVDNLFWGFTFCG